MVEKQQQEQEQGLIPPLACVAGVGEGGIWAREGERKGTPNPNPRSLLLRAWSRALIPFPFPLERLPRRPYSLLLTTFRWTVRFYPKCHVR